MTRATVSFEHFFVRSTFATRVAVRASRASLVVIAPIVVYNKRVSSTREHAVRFSRARRTEKKGTTSHRLD